MLAYKFKLNMDDEQKDCIDKILSFLTIVWNDNYQKSASYPNYCKLYNKSNVPKYVYSQCNQQLLKTLSNAWNIHFKNHIGRPKEKRKDIKSFVYPQYSNISYHQNNKIKLPNLGIVSYYNHSNIILENIRRVIIKKEFKYYYIIFVCNTYLKENKTIKKIGSFDFNLKTFLVSNENEEINIPNFYNKSLLRLKHLSKEKQRRHQKRKKKEQQSNSYHKTLKKLAKCHTKIYNQRKDFLHKISRNIANNTKTVIIEKLSIAELIHNTYESPMNKKQQRLTRRKYYNSGFNILANYLKYKCDKLLEINPRYTSKMCSNCNYINHELKISDRKWKCNGCNIIHNRDHNAALNILRLGKYILDNNTIEEIDISSVFSFENQ